MNLVFYFKMAQSVGFEQLKNTFILLIYFGVLPYSKIVISFYVLQKFRTFLV